MLINDFKYKSQLTKSGILHVSFSLLLCYIASIPGNNIKNILQPSYSKLLI